MSLVYLACRVCDRDSSDFLFEKSGWTIVRCRNCGFIYTNPIPTREDLQRYYSSRTGPTEKSSMRPGFLSLRQSILMKLIRSPRVRIWVRKARLIRWNKYLPQEGRLIDVGCAYGYLVLAAERMRKWACYGLDIQMHKLKYARSKYPYLSLYLGAVDELCFMDETFDIVIMTHVLEHTFDPLNTLLELSRILRTKGVLVVTVPDAAHPFARLMGKEFPLVQPPVHLWYFSAQTLARLLERTGMKVIHRRRLPLKCHLTVFAKKP